MEELFLPGSEPQARGRNGGGGVLLRLSVAGRQDPRDCSARTQGSLVFSDGLGGIGPFPSADPSRLLLDVVMVSLCRSSSKHCRERRDTSYLLIYPKKETSAPAAGSLL